MAIGFPVIRTKIKLFLLDNRYARKICEFAEKKLGVSQSAYQEALRYNRGILRLHQALLSARAQLLQNGIESISFSEEAISNSEIYTDHLANVSSERAQTYLAMAITAGDIRIKMRGILLDNVGVQTSWPVISNYFDFLNLAVQSFLYTGVGFVNMGPPAATLQNLLLSSSQENALAKLKALVQRQAAEINLNVDDFGRPYYQIKTAPSTVSSDDREIKNIFSRALNNLYDLNMEYPKQSKASLHRFPVTATL